MEEEEVEDEEDDEGASGIVLHLPREHRVHVFRESMEMGRTKLGVVEVHELMYELGRVWTRKEYDILRKNCAHFANAACMELGVGPIY